MARYQDMSSGFGIGALKFLGAGLTGIYVSVAAWHGGDTSEANRIICNAITHNASAADVQCRKFENFGHQVDMTIASFAR